MDKEYSLTIEKAKSVLNDNLILCQHDTGIDIYFRMINCPHLDLSKNKYTYSQLRLLSPSQMEIESDICPIMDNKVIFSITTELIERLEVGKYKGYIIVFDERGHSTVLPPISIEYKEYPIGGLNLSDATLNSSEINSDKVYKYANEIPFYNADGTYNRTLWIAGDIVSDRRLNKVEQVISDLTDYKILSKETFERLEEEKGYTLLSSENERSPIVISNLKPNSYLLQGFVSDFPSSKPRYITKKSYCIIIESNNNYSKVYRYIEGDDRFRFYKYDKDEEIAYVIYDDIVEIKSVKGILHLVSNKYQIATVESVTEVVMPDVANNFGEINIILSPKQTSTVIFPEIIWTVEPNLEINKMTIVTLTYLNNVWYGTCDTLQGIDPTKDRLDSDYDMLIKELKTYVRDCVAENNVDLKTLLNTIGFIIGEDDTLGIVDLSVKGVLTCNTLEVANLKASGIEKVLTSNKTVDITSGKTITSFLDSLPTNLGGNTVTINLKADSSENLELKRFTNGTIDLFLGGKYIKGTLRGVYNNSCYNIYGGKTKTDIANIGGIAPYQGLVVGTCYHSILLNDCPNVSIYNLQVSGATSNTETVGIGANSKSRVYLENISFVKCKHNVRTYKMSDLFCLNSIGKSTGHSWWADTGSVITLNNDTQASGTSNIFESGNGKVISTGVTFYNDNPSGGGSGGTTQPPKPETPPTPTEPVVTTRTVSFSPSYSRTFKSNTADLGWGTENACRQGNYGYGDCNGFMFFGDQFNTLKGKNITKVEMTVTRATATGISTPCQITFKAHGYAEQPTGTPSAFTDCGASITLGWNESGTVTINNATVLNGIKNGTIKGFGIQSAYDREHYAKITESTVKIYYQDTTSQGGNTSEVIATARITIANLNVRVAPGTTSNYLGIVHQGDVVEIVAVDSATGWYKIKYNNTYGYISGGSQYSEIITGSIS